jgi:membrane protease YdiL (CAAX protease family)
LSSSQYCPRFPCTPAHERRRDFGIDAKERRMSEGVEPFDTSAATPLYPPPEEPAAVRRGPYGPIPPGARLTWAWAAPIVQVAIYSVSIVPVMFATAFVMALLVAIGSFSSSLLTAPPDRPFDLTALLNAMISTVAVQIPYWAVFVILWIIGFERRGLVSAGCRPALCSTVAVAALMLTLGGATTPSAVDNLELPLLVTAIAVQFPVWALLVILWVRGFERRSLGSAGFRGPNALGKYLTGLLVGIAVAAVLAMLSTVVVGPASDATPEAFDLGRLLRPEWMLTMLGTAAMFLVQSACEEIAFRGWMMSTITARWGLVAGVVLNIVLFGALHAQVFVSGPVAGLAAIAAITCVGLFLSLWAIWQRSIVGVCGIHGGFNSALVLSGIIAGGATDPEATPGKVLLDTFKGETGLSGDASAAGVLLQLVVFAVLSGLVWLRLRRRR